MNKNLKSRGVTLIELSMAIAVMGLLIVAVIGGASVINIAQANKLVSILQGINSATEGFVSAYNRLPGDISANTLGSVLTSSGAVISPTPTCGNEDGKITFGGNAASCNEALNFAYQLDQTGLFLSSADDGDNLNTDSANTTAGSTNVIRSVLLPNYILHPFFYTGSTISHIHTNRNVILVGSLRAGFGTATAATSTSPGLIATNQTDTTQAPSAGASFASGYIVNEGVARNLDNRMDDGNATSGLIEYACYTAGGTIATYGSCNNTAGLISFAFPAGVI